MGTGIERSRWMTTSYCAALMTLVLLLIVFTTPLSAQVDTGAVVGTIRDQSGAVVPGARVSLINEGTGRTSSKVTGQDGFYVFTPVPIGSYTIRVEKQGFQAEVHQLLTVQVQQQVLVNFTLRPGAVTQTVHVTSAAPLLQTRDASVGQVVGSTEVNDLPLNGRNYTFLAQLVPGVTHMQQETHFGLEASGSFTANGTNWNDSNYILDGIDNNNTEVDNESGTTYALLPPIDAIQEFKVDTTDYTAELGRAAGAVINTSLKSGTNRYHGDVWEFLRNDQFDSADFFENAANLSKGEFRQNQYGFTLGGPLTIPKIYRGQDKTFFFVDYEGTRIRHALPQVSTVPTVEQRDSGYTDLSQLIALEPGTTPTDLLGRTFAIGQVFDPATTRSVTQGQVDPVTGLVATGTGYVRDPFAGNMLPAGRLDANAIRLLNLYPLPTTSGLFNNFTSDSILKDDTDSYDVRMDEMISEHDQTFVRFSYNHNPEYIPSSLPGLAQGIIPGLGNIGDNIGTSSEWSETHTFSPTTVNEFRVGYIRLTTPHEQALPDTLGLPQEFGIQGIPQYPGNGGLPDFAIGGATTYTTTGSGLSALGTPSYLPTYKDSEVWDIRENLTRISGSHTIRAGFETQYDAMPYLIPPYSRGYFDFSGEYTSIPSINVGSNGIAQFLLTPGAATVPNGVNNVGGADQVFASSAVDTTELRKYYAGYVQDDWRLLPKLTVNLGLRYEYFSPYYNRYDASAMFLPGPPFAGAEYLYPVGREHNPTLPAAFIQTLSKDGIALKYANNVYGYSSLDNVAPRFGFAYQVSPKLVARGGYGIFYGGFVNSSGGDHEGTNNFPFLFSLALTAPDPAHPITPNNSVGLLENGLLNVPVTPGAVTPSIGFNSIGRQFYFPTPYTQGANFSLQYQLTPNQTIQAGYVGTFGRHLEIAPGANNVSEMLPPSVNYLNYIPFPDFAPGFTYVTFDGDSNYSSFQLSFQRRFSSGLTFLGDYTYSKCRSDALDLLNNTLSGYRAPDLPGFGIQGDYALCDMDVRNLVHFSGTYALPVGQGKSLLSNSRGLANAALGGWTINWIVTLQDGQPFTVPCNITTAAGLGCDALTVPGQNVIGGKHNVNQWMNPAAFTDPPVVSAIGQTSYGPLGGSQTQLVGPGFHRLDLSLFKEFRTSESTHLEFRAEFFNIFNIPNFALPSNVNFSSPAFGAITSTLDNPNDPREIQFALKFYW
jgi:hypothetical protein